MKWLLIFFATLSLGGCADLSSGMCGNNTIQTVQSPNGQLKAVIFERDCGATTDFSTQVSVLPVQASLGNRAGNIFTVDGNHGAAPSGRGGGPNVWVKWLGPNKLKIVYDLRARTFLMKRQHLDVSIVYKAN